MLTRDVQETVGALLKHHTAQEHLALEAVVLPWLQGLHTIEDYNALLKLFYGYFKPVEDSIVRYIGINQLPDIQERRKGHWILRDLTFSNAHTHDLPLAANLPKINNLYQAFGALYVLEGSTLGGRGITKMLLKNKHLHLQEDQVLFFSGYGADTGARWIAFLHCLNQQRVNNTALEQMIDSAKQTFTLFKSWIQEHDA